MRIMGLDLGTKTLGIALTDKLGVVSSPYTTLRCKENDFASFLPELKRIIKEKEVEEICLGLPKNMDGTLGFAAQRSLLFQKMLQEELKQEIYLVDERLSTKEAEDTLIRLDTSRQKRKKVIDAYAASILLDTYKKEKEGD